MSNEVVAREAGDASLEAKIDADMSNEVVAREAADTSLATKIDADVSSEASLRVAGDQALTAKINSDVSSEASSRVAADATLQSNIDVEKGRIDAILSGASIDLDQFKEIVSFVEEVDLENDNALLAAVNSINTAISDEAAAREAGDTAVRTDMTDAILSAKTDVELQVSDEITARQSAVTSLEVKHDAELADVNSKLATEESARIATDATLQASIDTLTSDLADEVTAREEGDTSLESKITDIISNTDFTAMDSFSEVTNHLTRLEDNHVQKAYVVSKATNQSGDMIGFQMNKGQKQNTIQVFLNGQLLVEGVDWTIATSTISLDVKPAAGEPVGAIKLNYNGRTTDNYTVYGVPFQSEISYGGYGY